MRDLKRGRGFYHLFAIGLSQSLGSSIITALFSMYAMLYFNASMATIGFLSSMNALASLLIAIPSGVLSDKFGRKPMIILGVTLNLVGTAFLFLASSVEVLFIAQIVLGLSLPIFAPSSQALVADIASKADSGKTVGFYLLSPSIGMFSGPLVASLLLRFVTIRNTFLYSLIIVLPSVILSFGIRSPRSTAQSPSRISLGDFGKTMKNRSVLIPSLVSGSFFFLQSSLLAFYPIYALEQYHADPAIVATIFSLRSLVLMLSRILAVTSLASRIGEKRLIIMALIATTSAALLPLTQSWEQSAIFIALSGVGHGVIWPMGAMIVAESTSSQERGTANSIYFLFFSISSTFSPVLMGFAAEAWGIAALFPILAVAPVVGLISSKFMP